MIRIIEAPLKRSELKEMAQAVFGDMVKAVVDVERGLMAVGGELHSDEEAFLIERGSSPRHLWGINLYPDLEGDGFIEFDSMINLKPSHNNLSRGVEDKETRDKIMEIATKLVK